LDSLADVVSFGVLPSTIMFSLMHDVSRLSWLPYTAFLITVFSALRLAKFNIDESQKDSFMGLPTPANAIFISSLIFLHPPASVVTTHELSLLAITFVFSLLLVSPFPLFALKFKSFKWRDNKLRFTFIGLSVLLFAWQQAAALPFVIILYIGLSLTEKRFAKLLT
jgi:CDP-diacylglycerol--serine O-phosphatidyltransferase